jgi:hypothetical protein
MQTLSFTAIVEKGYRYGTFQVAVSLLVHSHTFADGYQEIVFNGGTPAASGTQALSTDMGAVQ